VEKKREEEGGKRREREGAETSARPEGKGGKWKKEMWTRLTPSPPSSLVEGEGEYRRKEDKPDPSAPGEGGKKEGREPRGEMQALFGPLRHISVGRGRKGPVQHCAISFSYYLCDGKKEEGKN